MLQTVDTQLMSTMINFLTIQVNKACMYWDSLEIFHNF